MKKRLRLYLQKIGLAEDATTEEATAFLGKLLGPERVIADRLAAEPDTADPPPDPPTPEPEPEPEPTPEPAPAADPPAPDTAALAAAGAAAERTRVRELYGLAQAQGLGDAWALEQIMAGRSVEQAMAQALTELRQTRGGLPRVQVGADRNLGTIGPALSDAILIRCGRTQYQTDRIRGRLVARLSDPNDERTKVRQPEHERSHDFSGMHLVDMHRAYLSAVGVPDAERLSRVEIVRLLSKRELRRAYPEAAALAQSTSDFDSILADAQNKSLRAAYLDAPATWPVWVRPTTNADFKTIRRAALSEAPNLVSRDEGGEVRYVTLTDTAETYALVEYTGGILLTRRAIINDDLDAFDRQPTLLANAARRKEDDVVYAILTANAALADGVTLFYATTHVNLVSGSANVGGPTVARLAYAEAMMMNQKGLGSAAFLELVPRFLIVPTNHGATAKQLIASTVDPSKSNGTVNPYHNALAIPRPSARLSANSTTAWYLAADYRDGQIDTLEICFLEGETEPVLAQETDFDTDDLKSKARHTVAAKAIDFRGLVSNPGA